MSEPYDEDILLWSERQSELLRRIAAGEPVNGRPDWVNIVEEVESVGRSDLRAVESLLLQAFMPMRSSDAWMARNSRASDCQAGTDSEFGHASAFSDAYPSTIAMSGAAGFFMPTIW
jgi:hypothetical protein